MFCGNCGESLEENSTFCGNCGSKTNSSLKRETPIAKSSSATAATAIAKSFLCSGCGSPLKIPKNSRGHVRCPFCKAECVIESLAKNAEMAAKENIASGIPLSASSATLHRKLVSHIAGTPNMPLDVFEKVEVIREEHHCVPAFYFYCNGTASFTYDAINIRQRQRKTTDDNRTVWENYKEATQMSGNANASAEAVTSGNKTFGPQIRTLYMFLDGNKLYDFSELEFPHDVITHDYNFPQTASFNEYVKPYMEELLWKNAENSLKGKNIRDLTLGGSRIDKNEVVRIYLGLYRVIFRYGGQEYSIWVTGDGEKSLSGDMPNDMRQKAAIDEKILSMNREVSSIPVPSTGGLTAGMYASVIGGIVLAIALHSIYLVLGLAGFITFWWIRSEKMNSYNAKCAEVRVKYQKEINDLEARIKNTVQQFKTKKQSLRGIYEQEVTGNASAF